MIIKHLTTNTTSAVSSLIPDCCNIGVIYRVLLTVNIACFFTIWIDSNSLISTFVGFIHVSVPVEMIVILSLIMLCGMRKVVLIQSFPAWLQRALCALVPALIAYSILQGITQLVWLHYQFAVSTMLKIACSAALLGLFFQHYF